MSANAPVLLREPLASTRIVRELLIALEQEGVPSQRSLAAANLSPEVVQLDSRLPCSSLYAMLAVAPDVTGDPAFGLRWGENARSFSIVTHLFVQASSLRRAFEQLFEFSELLTDALRIEVIEREDEVELRAGYAPNQSLPVRRLVAEVAMVRLMRMLRQLCPHGRILRACFDYRAPSYRSQYTRAFDSLECFEQPFMGLVFDRRMLDAPSALVDEDLHDALRAIAERRLSFIRQGGTYSHRVHALLVQRSAPHRVPTSVIASELKISERSLYRHLAEERTSYRTVVEASAATVARRMLQQERRTIQETAFSMGFSEVTSFHRAFKRWTGTTPRRARGRGRG